jgi:hypothetical protein
MPDFELTPKLLTKPVAIHIADTSAGAQKLLTNEAPGSTPVVFADADISLPAGTNVSFLSAGLPVTFNAGASVKIEILPGPEALAAEVSMGFDLAGQLVPVLQFPTVENTHYALLRWGYNVGAAGSGSIALGVGALGVGGSVTFGGDAQRSGIFAVVRQVPDGPGCRDILLDLVASWQLPKQVTSPDSLPEGTWLVAETNGHLGLNVSASYGYNFNWIRQATLNTLTGDIGLKIQSGVAASLSFDVTGKHAVVLSRGTGADAAKIRVRLYRLRIQDLKAGFSATVGVTPVTELLPAGFDEMIAGALGTSGAQIVKALKDVDSWTTPGVPLLGPFVGVGEEYLNGFVRSVTGQDLNQDLTVVKGQIQSALSLWDDLPKQTSALLWRHLPEKAIIGEIAGLAGQVADASEGTLSAFLANKLKSVAFLNSPAGQWLESITAKGVFFALGNSSELSKIQSVAGDVRSILDGSKVQELLTNLQTEINKRLNLAKLNELVDQASVANLDAWLTKKLTAFLGHDPKGQAALDELTTLRDQIHRLAAMRDEFYGKALAALQKTYTFSLAATYQQTTTTDALLDAEFDFAVDAADAEKCLALALDGQVSQLMSSATAHPSVTLNQAVLTHGVKRQSTVELTLPYFVQTETHVNDVLASISAIDHGEGRLLTVSASDNVSTVVNKRNKRDSTLTFSLSLKSAASTGLVIHEEPTATASYTLTETFVKMARTRFIARYQPELTTYFPTTFGTGQPTVSAWADALTTPNQMLGEGSISLEVTVPPAVLLAWMKAPAGRTDPLYKDLAIVLVREFRTILLQQYFADISRYKNVAPQSPVLALLAYSSVPMLFTNNGLPTLTNTSHLGGPDGLLIAGDSKSEHLHWNDAGDRNLTMAMLNCKETTAGMEKTLAGVREVVTAEGLKINGQNAAGFYMDAAQLTGSGSRNPHIQDLFDTERDLVNNARIAGLKIAAFLNSNATQRDVFATLEDFASKLTETFSAGLKTWASDTLLLPLGPYLLQAAAGVFDPPVKRLTPNAIFTVEAKTLAAPERLTQIAPVSALRAAVI